MLFLAVTEIVERRHAVGFRPHTDRTGAGDMAVFIVDVLLAVQDYLDRRAGELDAQENPLALVELVDRAEDAVAVVDDSAE